ncbi:MAG: hypothetical protein IAG10_12315 [Planctomycetaceae bacterium]|nr:hypothetical protein [Planctomycetaceae bacterium]
MNPQVEKEARLFVERAMASGQSGTCADAAELAALNSEMSERMPEWYVALLVSVPLCGLEVTWHSEEADGAIEWCDVKGIRSESLVCYLGIAILERGFINVGSDPYGSGDSYFMPTDQGDDPPVFQVYHDVSDQADEILADGLLQVAVRLPDLFRQASIVNQ